MCCYGLFFVFYSGLFNKFVAFEHSTEELKNAARMGEN